MRQSRGWRGVALAVAFAVVCAGLGGCGRGADERGRVAPHFEPGFNLLSPEQDVEVGRQAAAEVARQVPLLPEDAPVAAYVRDLGGRLAARAPGAKFPYEFHVANVREMNAFALPGGIVFVNRGTLDVVGDEGELAGVLAHEISHVALRHGTNQMSKAYVAQAGLGILQRILGGGRGGVHLGDVVAAAGGAGLNTLFLKFGRTAESQADLTGAQIMAGAGYDPIDMQHFFERLAERGGSQPPEFLSDHPDPGNRARAIEQVREAIKVTNPVTNTDAFRRMKADLKGLGPATSMRAAQVGPPGGPGGDRGGARPEPPSGSFETFRAPGGAYEVAYPSNWDTLSDGADAAGFAPKGAYGKLDDQLVVTHGVLAGVEDAGGADLETATRRFVEAQLHANPDFQVADGARQIPVGGLTGLGVPIAGPSPVTGVLEVDTIYTALLPDGRMFYVITVVPHDEAPAYEPAFAEVMRSIRIL